MKIKVLIIGLLFIAGCSKAEKKNVTNVGGITPPPAQDVMNVFLHKGKVKADGTLHWLDKGKIVIFQTDEKCAYIYIWEPKKGLVLTEKKCEKEGAK